MRIELYRSGSWIELFYPDGNSPRVVDEIETDNYFEFVAPYAEIILYDDGQTYAPGGTDEITRGEVIRIWAIEDKAATPYQLVEVFRGFVDRDISFEPSSGYLQIRAVGWLSLLKEVYLGRSTKSNPRYRYRQELADIPFEYLAGYEKPLSGRLELLAMPELYETTWENDRIKQAGFKKAWLFDTLPSRGQDPFLPESESAVYKETLADDWQYGVPASYVRSIENPQIDLLEVPIADVLAEVVKQLNHFLKYDDVTDWVASLPVDTRKFHVGDVDPGEILRIEQVDLKNQLWYADFRNMDGRYYLIATIEAANPRNLGDTIIYRIINRTTLIEVARLTDWDDGDIISRVTNGQDVGAFAEWIVDGERRHYWLDEISRRSFDSVRAIHNQRVVLIDGDTIIVYSLLSWFVEVVLTSVIYANDGTPSVGQSFRGYAQFYTLEWSTVNSRTGEQSDRYYVESHERVATANLGGLERYKSAVIDADNNASTDRPTVSTDDPVIQTSLQVEGVGDYAFKNRTAMFIGNLTLNNMAFAFEDIYASKMLLEMAKVSNSLVYVNRGMEISLVRRDYYNSSHSINYADIIQVTVQKRDRRGDPLPQIDSRIILNDTAIQAISDYYYSENQEADIYYTLRLRNTPSIFAINLLDRIRFRENFAGGLADDGIVLSKSYNDSEVNILAIKISEQHAGRYVA